MVSEPPSLRREADSTVTKSPHALPQSRLPFFDVLRGIALIAMTIYHFTWDLEFFGWILPGTITQPGWTIFARCIATSFLFLVGVSLFLAHGDGIRWQGFWKRLLQIVAAAVVITVATYIAFPQAFIFFGILHAIAVFSFLALAFVRLHWIFAAAAATAIFAVWQTTTAEFFQTPFLSWVGLSPVPPISNDYVPVFPWLAATLAGVAATKILAQLSVLRRVGLTSLPEIAANPLTFIGRHSLVYYLLHQPVMLGLLWVFTAIAGPPDRTASFLYLCTKQCAKTRGELFCKPYCECVADDMKREAIFKPFHAGEIDIATDPTAQTIIRQCTAAQKE